MNYIYVRQSSTKEDRSISCEEQISNCIQFASQHNIKVDGVFQDVNVSGRLFPKQFASFAEADIVYKQFLKETKKEGQWRNGLGQLFDVLKDGDTVIVDDLTRLYRPLTNSFLESALTQFLIGKNIKLLTVKNGEVNLNSFNDNLINALQNRINDNQLAIQRKKSKDSMTRLCNLGELKQGLGSMIGYKWTGKKKEVEIDTETAKYVQFIFKSFVGGKGILQICRELDESGFKTCLNSIKNILKRPLYCGYMYDTQGHLVKAKQVEGKELIDFQTWNTAIQLLETRKSSNLRIKIHPLHFTGLIFCGKCGFKMSVCINDQGKYLSYRCCSHSFKSKENCKISCTANTHYSKGLSLEDAVEPFLILGLLKKLNSSTDASAKKQLEQKRVELKNLLVQEQKFTDIFIKGLLDSSIYENNLTQLKEQKDSIQQEIIQLEQELTQDDTENLRLLVNKIVGRGLSYEEYQNLIPYAIKKIEVFEWELKVNTFFGDIILPRKKIRGIYTLPEYIWKNDGKEFKIYYYFNSPNIYQPHKKLFHYNNLTIYQLVEN